MKLWVAALVGQRAKMASKRVKRRRAIEGMLAARKRGDRVLDRVALRPARKMYDIEASRVTNGMRRALRGSMRDPLTVDKVQQAQAFLRRRLQTTGFRVGGVLADGTRDTLTEGVRTTSFMLDKVLEASTELHETSVLRSLVSAKQVELELIREDYIAHMTTKIQSHISNKLNELLLYEDTKVSDLVTETGELLDDSWWRVERAVRTETSFAYNQAQRDAVDRLSEDDDSFRGKLYSRWTEFINDLTGVPYDDRVAGDSIAMHGQVAKPGKPFTMPSLRVVPSTMVGSSWTHPPNRPNDRAILTPWMADWGVPAWRIRGTSRSRL